MTGDSLRLSTAEREQASARLADHFAEGRLDHDEYAERLDRIWAARTRGDLRPVFRDLPAREWGVTTATRTTRAVGPRRRPRLPVSLALVLALLVAVAVLSHLPLLLVGLAVWFFVLRGRCGPAWGHRRW